jgi:hypothetical protein
MVLPMFVFTGTPCYTAITLTQPSPLREPKLAYQ